MTSLSGLTADAPPAPGVARPISPAMRERRLASRLGWIGAAAMAGSVLMMIAVSAAGPSAVVPVLPRTWPVPPLWFPMHVADVTVTATIYVALILGGTGSAVACPRSGAACSPSSPPPGWTG